MLLALLILPLPLLVLKAFDGNMSHGKLLRLPLDTHCFEKWSFHGRAEWRLMIQPYHLLLTRFHDLTPQNGMQGLQVPNSVSFFLAKG